MNIAFLGAKPISEMLVNCEGAGLHIRKPEKNLAFLIEDASGEFGHNEVWVTTFEVTENEDGFDCLVFVDVQPHGGLIPALNWINNF